MGNITAVRDLLRDANDNLVENISEFTDQQLNFETDSVLTDVIDRIPVHELPGILAWRATDPYLSRTPMLLLGASAIGKTEAVRQGVELAAEIMGRSHTIHEMHVSQMMIADVMGVPRDDGKGRTVYYPPRAFNLISAEPEQEAAYQAFLQEFHLTGKTNYELLKAFPWHIYFWDEVTNPSNPSTVHQCFSLWMGNFVADHPLTGDCFHILAGNRAYDGTNSIELAKSAVTRVDKIEVVPSFAGWLQNFALKVDAQGNSRIHPMIIAYLWRYPGRFAPETLDLEAMTAHPSPRTWEFASKLMYAWDRKPTITETQLKAMVAGHIGEAETNTFWAFKKYWEEVPDVNRLLNSNQVGDGPYGWLPKDWPTRPDLLMMMVTQMSAKLDERNAKRYMAFLMDVTKFDKEYSGIAIKMLRPMNKLQFLAHDWAPAEFSKWCLEFKEFMI